MTTLGLGSVQWGCEYGISNTQGRPNLSEVQSIINAAEGASVSVIDTASLYGDAERVLSHLDLQKFRVVTKSPIFHEEQITDDSILALSNSVRNSICTIGVKPIYGYLFHRGSDLLKKGGTRLLAEVTRNVDRGEIQNIGVSVYNPDELNQILEVFTPDIVQLPLNVLDQRFINSGQIKHLHEIGVEIHVRSIYLQGLLLMQAEEIPSYLADSHSVLKKYEATLASHGISKVAAAVAFIKSVDEIDVALVGCNTLQEFEQTNELFQGKENMSVDFSEFSCSDEHIINPSLWSQ